MPPAASASDAIAVAVRSHQIDRALADHLIIERSTRTSMRCPQCGFDTAANAAFCSRCGTRIFTPRPETRHEYALTRILPSWWHFSSHLILIVLLIAGGLAALVLPPHGPFVTVLALALAALTFGLVSLIRNHTSWSLTSDRLIERQGFLARRRREMELADIRSIEVDRSLKQRMLGLGNVAVASSASADFMIRLFDIPDPERVAEILRKARLKRLA
jgi:membrane protein YdbS with pleckstrin-like domain